MGKDFYERLAGRAATSSTRPTTCSGFDLAELCFDGPEERLNQTDISQPAIYVTSVASFRAARGRRA